MTIFPQSHAGRFRLIAAALIGLVFCPHVVSIAQESSPQESETEDRTERRREASIEFSMDAERISFVDEADQPREATGRVLVEAADGGLLLLGEDGRLWPIGAETLRQREEREAPFSPLTARELGRQLLEEMGEGFQLHVTRHYVICTNAGRDYARWCGGLLERLFNGFQTYWKANDIELDAPEFPLPVIILANQKQFATFAEQHAGAALSASQGYYSVGDNRIVLYDLTATATNVPGGGNRTSRSSAELTRKLAAQPFNVATVVHEATHQIAFNTGLHTRYADNPQWLTEGMAMYFETPDLRSRSGWRTIGRLNTMRLRQFQDFLRRGRPEDSLRSLIADNRRFQQAETATDAYAEAWALTTFLIRTRRDAYRDYVRTLSDKPPLVWDEPDDRLNEFREAFGDDLNELDREFLRFVRRLGN